MKRQLLVGHRGLALGRPNLKSLWKDLHETEWGKRVAKQREQRTQASVTGRGVWVAVERFDLELT